MRFAFIFTLFVLFNLDLSEEFINLPANGGILSGTTGAHYAGSERDGEIPMICKRYLLILFNDVMAYADDDKVKNCGTEEHGDILKKKTYGSVKRNSVEYFTKKKYFFEFLKKKKLLSGNFPVPKPEVNDFVMDLDQE